MGVNLRQQLLDSALWKLHLQKPPQHQRLQARSTLERLSQPLELLRWHLRERTPARSGFPALVQVSLLALGAAATASSRYPASHSRIRSRVPGGSANANRQSLPFVPAS